MTSIKRKAILITGVHRSGTSALARAVNLLGAEIGSGLLPAVHGDNDRGYWELSDLVALNDECLEHFGLSWDDPRPMPTNWVDDPWLEKWRTRVASVITKNFPQAPLIVIKDPRISRLAPIWHQMLESAGFDVHTLIMLRHPLEVTASLLHRRDSQLDATEAHWLWLRYLVDAELGSRNHPRAWVRFDRLLRQWKFELPRLAQELQLTWPEPLDAVEQEIASFLDTGSRHQHAKHEVDDPQNDANRASTDAYHELVERIDAKADLKDLIDDASNQLKAYIRARRKSGEPFPGDEDFAAKSVDAGVPKMDLWTPAVLLRMQSHLYFRTEGTSYSQERSVAVEAQQDGDDLMAVFPLPEDAQVQFIRFDPSHFPGIYYIKAIAVDDQHLRLGAERVTAACDRKLSLRDGESYVCLRRQRSVGRDRPVQATEFPETTKPDIHLFQPRISHGNAAWPATRSKRRTPLAPEETGEGTESIARAIEEP